MIFGLFELQIIFSTPCSLFPTPYSLYLMNKIIIFDTTMRDGELMPGVKFNLQQKISISKLLEEIGIDVIEVSYPANSPSDFEQALGNI